MKYLAAIILFLIPGVALAQAFCGPRAMVLEELSSEYSESPVAVGATNTGGAFEVLASPAGTWTVLITHPAGVSCVMVAGDGWEMNPVSTDDPVPFNDYEHRGQ